MINAGSIAQEDKKNFHRRTFCACSGWLHRHLPCPPCSSNCGDRLPSYRNVCNKPSRRVSCYPNIIFRKTCILLTSFQSTTRRVSANNTLRRAFANNPLRCVPANAPRHGSADTHCCTTCGRCAALHRIGKGWRWGSASILS